MVTHARMFTGYAPTIKDEVNEFCESLDVDVIDTKMESYDKNYLAVIVEYEDADVQDS